MEKFLQIITQRIGGKKSEKEEKNIYTLVYVYVCDRSRIVYVMGWFVLIPQSRNITKIDYLIYCNSSRIESSE